MSKEIEYIERNIDVFEKGQLLVLRFPSAMDENNDGYIAKPIFCGGIKKEGIDEEYNTNVVYLPAIIRNKRFDKHDSPSYDVSFLTKWNTGEASGFIDICDMAVWRYLYNKDGAVEGNPPNYLIEEIIESNKGGERYLHDIPNEEIYYIVEDDSGKPYKKYVI